MYAYVNGMFVFVVKIFQKINSNLFLFTKPKQFMIQTNNLFPYHIVCSIVNHSIVTSEFQLN